MAQAPKPVRLSIEDYLEDADEKTGEVLKKLFKTLNPYLNDVSSAMSSQLLIGQNVAGTYKTVDVVAPATAWIAPTLLNSWANLSASTLATAGYRIDLNGQVHLKGWISGGTAVSGTALFTLPEGYRPPLEVSFPTVSNGVFGEVAVQTDGAVEVRLGASASLSLNGMSFDATSPAPPAAFVGAGWPIVMTHGLAQQPKKLEVAKVRSLESDNEIAVCGDPSWKLDQNNNVVVNYVSGLVPERKYQITFLMMP